MDNKFLYRSSLKNKEVPKFEVMGIVSELILSKVQFPKNNDIIPFLEEIFKQQFKDYVMKSRTLIVSRLIKIINNSDNDTFNFYRVKLLKYIESFYETEDKKSTSLTSASKWVTRR